MELDEAVEEIRNLKQKLSIQREKCHSFQTQQDVLMDILNIPSEERNFLSLRKGLEKLKNEYIIEKDRADNLACIMPITDPENSFKCYYFENGCKQEFLIKKVHEKSCNFQKVVCPFYCKELIVVNDLKIHLDQDHKIVKIDDEWNFEGSKNDLVKTNCYLKMYDERFFPKLYIKDGHLYFKVIMYIPYNGSKEDVMDFKACFTFFQANGKIYKVEESVYPITKSDENEDFSSITLQKLTKYYDSKSKEYRIHENVRFNLKITNDKRDEIARNKRVNSAQCSKNGENKPASDSATKASEQPQPLLQNSLATLVAAAEQQQQQQQKLHQQHQQQQQNILQVAPTPTLPTHPSEMKDTVKNGGGQAQVNLSGTGVTRTSGTATLTAQQLQPLQLAKGSGGVLQAALNNALRGAVTGITRPMVNALPTGAGGQTAVLRPQQLRPGQQRIALHQPGGVIQGQPRLVQLARTPGGQIVVVDSPQGAQKIRQQIGVASAAEPDYNSAFLKFINGGNNTASSANKIETTSGDTKPKENAKGRFSCKLCDKNYMFLKEHERNIHGAPGPGCYGPWPAAYFIPTFHP